jgi:putative transposase
VDWFLSLEDARGKIEVWWKEYNETRIHRALGERTLNEFAKEIASSHDLIGS